MEEYCRGHALLALNLHRQAFLPGFLLPGYWDQITFYFPVCGKHTSSSSVEDAVLGCFHMCMVVMLALPACRLCPLRCSALLLCFPMHCHARATLHYVKRQDQEYEPQQSWILPFLTAGLAHLTELKTRTLRKHHM